MNICRIDLGNTCGNEAAVFLAEFLGANSRIVRKMYLSSHKEIKEEEKSFLIAEILMKNLVLVRVSIGANSLGLEDRDSLDTKFITKTFRNKDKIK
jgi:hypothetical protein